jgi:hypothetical protein
VAPANDGHNAVFGESNTVSATHSVVGGKLQGLAGGITGSHHGVFGLQNTVGGLNNLVGSTLTTITGSYNVVGGQAHSVQGSDDLVSGSGHTIGSGTHNVVGGQSNFVDNGASLNAVFGGSNTITGAKNYNIIAGQGHVTTGSNNAIFGITNTVSANAAIASGESNNVSGLWSGGFGAGNIVSGGHSFAFGDGNEISGVDGFAAGSLNLVTNNQGSGLGQGAKATRWGEIAHTGKTFGGSGKNGESQASLIVGGTDTANDTPREIELNYGVDQYVPMENDTTNYFEVIVVGRNKDIDTESAAYKFEGVITRGTTAATTTIFGLVKTIVYEDVVAWDANVDADTTNGRLRTKVTGVAATNIRWTMRIKFVQVKG